MQSVVPNQRILRGTAAVLNVTLLDADGSPADAVGTVTIRVQKADGTNILPAGSSTTNPAGAGTYSRNLTAAETATLELLTATWTDGGDSSTYESVHEIVGGFFFSIAEARASDASLVETKYPDATVLATRLEVEVEAEDIVGVAFVPRFRRVRLSGAGTSQLKLPNPLPRTIRSVRTYSDAATYSALTSADLAEIALSEDGTIERADGGVFSRGVRNVVVEYEHGFDRPPADLKRAALTRLRHRLNFSKSGIPDRATSFVAAEGGNFRLDTAGPRKTGIPEVDAVYGRYAELFGGTKESVAAGSFDFDPAHGSLFHGGRR